MALCEGAWCNGVYSLCPGVRASNPAAREQWAYLDEPAVRERLLDFSDETQSRVTFHVPAIHCIACVWLLENLFQLHPGIGRSQVNFPKRTVAISFAPARGTPAWVCAQGGRDASSRPERCDRGPVAVRIGLRPCRAIVAQTSGLRAAPGRRFGPTG